MKNRYWLESTLNVYGVILNDIALEVHISNKKIVAIYNADNRIYSSEDIELMEEYLSELISK